MKNAMHHPKSRWRRTKRWSTVGLLTVGYAVAWGLTGSDVAQANPVTWQSVGPTSPADVYAMTTFNGTLYAGTDNHVWTLSNNSWNRLSSSPTYVQALLSSGGTLYAGGSNGVYTFDGTTWTKLNGSPTGTDSLLIIGSTLYAGTINGVYSYNGSSWASLGSFPNSIYALQNVNGTLYAGTLNDMYSYQGGTSWHEIDPSFLTVQALLYVNNTLYVSGYSATGVYTESGGTFTKLSGSPSGVTSLIEGDNGIIYAMSSNGLYSYNGSSWTTIASSPTSVISIYEANGILYAGTETGTNDVQAYNIQSNTWSYAGPLSAPQNVYTLLAENGTLYAGASNSQVGIWTYSGGVWAAMNGSPSNVDSLIDVGGTLYAGTGNASNNVWKDSGGTWTQIPNSPNGIVYALVDTNGTLYAVVEDPSTYKFSVQAYSNGTWAAPSATGWQSSNDTLVNVNGTLYAGSTNATNGVEYDNNGTWTTMNDSPGDVQWLFNVGGTLFAQTYDSSANTYGLSYYSNGTWKTSLASTTSYINWVTEANGTLYAGMNTGSNDVWSYTNGSWAAMTGSPSNVDYLLSDGSTLYAGSNGGVESLVTSPTNAATPSITAEPTNQTVNVGDSRPTLSVVASVTDGGTLSYQWYRNSTNTNSGGTLISGATSASYAAPTTTAGTTYYYCIVTNTNTNVTGTQTATATTDAASVTVKALVNAATPTITTEPTDQTVHVGDSRPSLQVVASVSDGGTLSYQWYRNATSSNSGGTLISGATTAAYTAPTTVVGTVYYYCEVTNTNTSPSITGLPTATAISDVASVAVTPMPVGPSLTADTTNNDMDHALNITFTDDPAWDSAITKVLDDGTPLPSSDYHVNPGDLVIDAGVLNPGQNTITVDATEYTSTSVVQDVLLATPIVNPPTDISSTGASLSWDKVPDAVTYSVYAVGVSDPIVKGLSAATLALAGLSPDTRYSYYVVAVSQNGTISAQSTPVSFTTAKVGTISLQSSPTQVTSGQKVTISGVVDDVYGSPVSNVPVTLSASGGEFGVTGTATQTVNADVYGRFSASWTAGQVSSRVSVAVTASVYRVIGGNTSIMVVPSAPAAPTGLTVGSVSTSSVVLNWKAAGGATQYDVYKDGSGVPLASGIQATTYVVNGLSPSTSYTFIVTALNDGGESPRTASIQVTTMAQPVTPPPTSGQGSTGSTVPPTGSTPPPKSKGPVTVTSPPVVQPGQPGKPFSQPLSVTGGKGPYKWAIVKGALPAGLTLNPTTGVVSGTSHDKSPKVLTVTVTDSNGVTQTKQVVVDLVPKGEQEIVWRTTGLHAVNIPSIVRSNPLTHSKATYLPIWYIQKILKSYGVTAKWNGKSWSLETQSKGVYTRPSHFSGSNGIYVNGILVDHVTALVARDPYSKVQTAFLPRWYLQSLLNRLHIKNSWNGTTWTIQPHS